MGSGDLLIGEPTQHPDFSFSECHDHFHYDGYASYEIRDASGAAVLTARKQAYCLLDTERIDDDSSVAAQRRYSCSFQGIQRGWADIYGSRLPCQFLDVTDLAPGAYTLRVELNQERKLEELDYSDNAIEIAIDLEDESLGRATESCPADLDPRVLGTVNRECGWKPAGVFDCTPGEQLRVGCNDGCGPASLGSCEGDMMLRVCDPARPDGNCSHPGSLARDNDACGNGCPLVQNVACPASGQIEVLAAALDPAEPVACDVATIAQ